MAVNISSANPDVLTPEFRKIFYEGLAQLPTNIPALYDMPDKGPRGDSVKYSQVGTMGDWTQFTGTVPYNTISQGYDVTMTHVEFANGFQLERKLLDDDLYHIYSGRPKGLASSYNRTREGHGARTFNNAFSVDTFFSNNTEAVALCSNSHTTTSGASTTTGFDNLITSAFSAVALATAYIQMSQFRGDQAERFQVNPNEILYPVDLYEAVFEVVNSMGKVDTDLNNPNVHHGAYDMIRWNYLTDTNNWFVMDSRLRREFLKWHDRIPVEFTFAEDQDTISAKWRGYARYTLGYVDWRFILGAQVA